MGRQLRSDRDHYPVRINNVSNSFCQRETPTRMSVRLVPVLALATLQVQAHPRLWE
jgi:hypothetical protein